VPPQQYIIKTQYYSAFCGIGIYYISNKDWILGDTFLRGYYSVWDHPNNKVKLTPHRTSVASIYPVSDMSKPKASFITAYQEDKKITFLLNALTLVLMGGVTTIGIGGIGYFLFSFLL
jgi:hypothetical protein